MSKAAEPLPTEPPQQEEVALRSARDTYGWLASFGVHAVALVLLALLTLPPIPLGDSFNLLGDAPPNEQIDDAISLEETLFDLSTDDLNQPLESAMDAPMAPPTPDALAVAPAPALDLSSLLSTSAIATPTDSAAAVVSGSGTDGRSAVGKAALVAAKGGSPASEAAVARGLKWISQHQNPDGSWSLNHAAGACRGRCGNPASNKDGKLIENTTASATGLALLPFLGAGETHQSGRHRKVVAAGLDALIRQGKKDKDNPGLSWADSGNLYAHGISTICLCEAYGITGDPSLRAPAQAALDYLAYAQDPKGGGWRYRAQQEGDTSVTGWQIMGLKSGMLAELKTPRRVVNRASKFLDALSAAGGSQYGYVINYEEGEDDEEKVAKPVGGRPTTSAVGLLCRMYLGWDQSDARLAKGVKRLSDRGPISGNFYHNYYAAQAIFHQTGGVGAVWRKWNEATREMLVEQQSTRGHERGSWYVKGGHTQRGGRLYTTAMATMTLEVYYRYLPLYKAEAVSFELPD
ncbi:hypothetical protein MalM25_28750 [Planctomycetes bacterium MalM25]|nr:hypothetical protein MalM25_28750 [Planctomycetes bacterium MalM25]